jgi:hypothetical protein
MGNIKDMDFGDIEKPCEYDDKGSCIHHGNPIYAAAAETDIIKATLENLEKVGGVLGSIGLVLRMGKMIFGGSDKPGPYAELEDILRPVVAPLLEAINRTRALLQTKSTETIDNTSVS